MIPYTHLYEPQSLGRCYIIWFINEENRSRDGKEDKYFFRSYSGLCRCSLPCIFKIISSSRYHDIDDGERVA